MGGMWCVLRTSGPNTLPLARSLGEAGYEVWTPIERQVKRLPRKKVEVERESPIMPTYVFASADDLLELVNLSLSPLNNHRAFSVFRYLNKYPLIADSSLEALRGEESRRALASRKRKKVVLAKGATVRIEEGAFAGMSGVVETSKGKFTLVCFPGYSMPVQIASWILATDSVSEQSIAA